MVKLVALKKLRYPRGRDGKEYVPGESFDALSERDAKALTLVRAAKVDDGPTVPDPQPRRRGRPPKPRPPVVEGDVGAVDHPDATVGGSRIYERRDMQAED